ncbi:hypothetical protein LCGC14_2798120 [marine sediment metagenome]|uniref:HNH nuclease domain-containing protein n=1 Tax=marine sediment metagenome TaxID=412755 RepID=A0A0F9BEW8_9ZZZZ
MELNKNITYTIVPGPLDTDCFICTSHKPNTHGYPQVKRNGNKQQLIHRYLYQIMFGSISNNKHIHHICENKLCINVQHLMPKEHGVHITEHHKGKPNPKNQGSKHPQAKLTEKQVKTILSDTIHTCQWLGDKHNVTRGLINDIKHRKKWKHIQEVS